MESDLVPEPESETFQTVVAVMIAVVTLLGALVYWIAGNASAAGADYYGQQAVLNAEQTLTLNNTSLHRHYRAYTNYVRSSALLGALDGDPAATSAGALEAARTEAAALASTNQLFFPNRYLNRDGTYAVERELGEAWAQASQVMDLNPDPHFAEAAVLRIKYTWFIAVLVALAFSLLFYTIAQALHASRHAARLVFAVAATLLLVGGVAATFLIQRLG